MPPAAVRIRPGWSDDRAGEAAAAMAEQLAVGELARRGRAVVGQERGGAARRADVDGARDQLLAGAALAGDQHRQVVALQPLNLIDDARHRGAGAEESRQQRLERALDRADVGRARSGARARRTGRSPGARRPPSCARGAATRWPSGRAEARSRDTRGPSGSRAERLDHDACRRRRRRLAGERAPACARRRRRRRRARPGARRRRQRARRPPRIGGNASSSAAAISRAEQVGQHRRIHQRRTSASSASAGEPTYSPVPGCRRAARAPRRRPRESRVGAERPEDRRAPDRECRSAIDRAPALRGQRGRARAGSPPPDSARRPARTRSSSARCRGTPRWCGPLPWRSRRAARRNSPQAPGVVRGSSASTAMRRADARPRRAVPRRAALRRRSARASIASAGGASATSAISSAIASARPARRAASRAAP